MATTAQETDTTRPATRAYRMHQRAREVERTRASILDAAMQIGKTRVFTLSEVAAEADVSTRTIIRHFGSRSGLAAATIELGTQLIAEERFAVDPGDIEGAISNLVDHYEDHGDAVLVRLSQEGSHPDIDQLLERGRRLHREWVAQILGIASPPDLPAGRRRRVLAQLVAVTDVYSWKLLRRDSGLTQSETKTAITELVTGALAQHRRSRT